MVRQAVTPEPNGKIRCDACPVLCYDPFTLMQHIEEGPNEQVVEFLRQVPDSSADNTSVESVADAVAVEPWNGQWLQQAKPFVTAIGAQPNRRRC